MIATLATRAFQVIFGVVALALSIEAIKWTAYGSAPAIFGYSAFAGAFCILVGLIGSAVVFVDSVPGLFMAAADGLAVLILAAAGIAFAVEFKGVNCGSSYEDGNSQASSSLLNGGCTGKGDNFICGIVHVDNPVKVIHGRCHTAEADIAFLFLGCVACIAAAILCFIGTKRGGTRHSAV